MSGPAAQAATPLPRSHPAPAGTARGVLMQRKQAGEQTRRARRADRPVRSETKETVAA